LSVTPLLPADWQSFELSYRFGKTLFRISVDPSPGDGVQRLVLDGVLQSDAEVRLIDDGREHSVEIGMPRIASAVSLTLA
jgi:cyclic beta-1,2-glucan synthetase